MKGRRDFLKVISSLSLVAPLHGMPAVVRSVAVGDSSGPIRWPKPIGSPVLESIRPAIEHSRDVFTHFDKIVEVAGWMGYEVLAMPIYPIPSGVKSTDPNDVIDLILVALSLIHI